MKEVIFSIFVLICFIPSAFSEGQIEYTYNKIMVNETDSSALKNTAITPVLEAKIVPNKNLVYCATFQLAWNELSDTVYHDTITLENSPEYAVQLSRKMFKKEYLSGDSYVAGAGVVGEGIIEELKTDLKQKFDYIEKVLEEPWPAGSILFYAYMSKNLPFKNVFDGTLYINFEFGEERRQVSAFGYSSGTEGMFDKIRDQVKIFYYEEKTGNCIVSLVSESMNDEIILAKILPGKTLLETVQKTLERVSRADAEELAFNDTIVIPKIIFKLGHTFKDLYYKQITTVHPRLKGYYITVAKQTIDFRLDEKGAMLVSRGSGGAEGIASTARSLIYDRPFIVMLRQKDAPYPYFAAWIADPELLIDYNSPDEKDIDDAGDQAVQSPEGK
ncbi:MAG: hypothetical protein JW904_09680 [Spirochaetales bacterium]|nr:hypothetical protein [Spirochaetales bacterium]